MRKEYLDQVMGAFSNPASLRHGGRQSTHESHRMIQIGVQTLGILVTLVLVRRNQVGYTDCNYSIFEPASLSLLESLAHLTIVSVRSRFFRFFFLSIHEAKERYIAGNARQ